MTKMRLRIRAFAQGFWALVFVSVAFKLKLEPPYFDHFIVQLFCLAVAGFLAIHAIRNYKTTPSNSN